MRWRHRSLVPFAAAAAAAALAACSPTRIQSGPRVRIAIGGATQLVYLPTTLAERLGYYRDEGLEVELQGFAGGAKSLEALFGGSSDVVSGFFDHTVQMAAEGKPLRAFVLMIRYPGLALVASPAAARTLESPADLDGANVGVSSPGSSTHFFLNHVLTRANLAPSKISAIGIGMSAASVAAMQNGRVDAAVMAEPAISQLAARSEKPLRILADTRNEAGVRKIFGTASYPASVLYSKSEWVEANPLLAGKLARAIRRALAWIHGHTAREIALAMPPEYRTEDLNLYIRAIDQSKAMYSPDGAIAKEGAEAVVRVMSETLASVRSANIDVTRCYTNEFLSTSHR